jgi:glycosyltransferase involved in cell wall biosynthesis
MGKGRRSLEGVGMSGPGVSVVMLTYNRESFVTRAVESVLAQTFHDFEFIIVDNGSTDRSGAIAEEYARRDARIRVIHKARGNIGGGRNAGLEAARGGHVAFIDDDDWCEPDFLEFLTELEAGNEADAVICGATKWENGTNAYAGVKGEPMVMNAEASIIELLWRKRYNNGFPAKLFKRSLFENLRFPETGEYDDIHLMYKVLAKAGRVAYHGLPKYNVTRHESNNSAATEKHGMMTAAYLDVYRAVYRERADWLCERFPANAGYWRYFDWSFQISMVEKIVRHHLRDCEKHLAEMRRELAEHRRAFLDSPHILDFEREWAALYI